MVKVMVQSPNIEILTYNIYEHEDENGWPCHGKHDTSVSLGSSISQGFQGT
jgi:hypothetical protein